MKATHFDLSSRENLFRENFCANHEHIRNDTVVTSDSCNSGHSENYEKILTFRVRA